MNIAITGHRPNKLGNDYDLKSPLVLWIKSKIVRILQENLSEDNIIYAEKHRLITGMALGIDTLFAQIALEMSIPFIAAIPCINQEKLWSQKSKDLYWKILNNPLCTKHFVSDKSYDNICLQRRNEWMVNECDKLIAVFDGSKGGTNNCIKYAKWQGMNEEIIYINPKKL